MEQSNNNKNMKYMVRNYQEGCESEARSGFETLEEARSEAKTNLSNHDESQGRKMRKHRYVIDDSMDGYEPIESWTAQGNKENGDNESDYTTIFKRV